MAVMDLLSIQDAARRMELHPVHVRRLVRDGEIAASKVGGRWLVSESAVRERMRLQPPAGRPLSANMAWAVLGLVGAGLRDSDDAEAAPSVADMADRRARYRLRRLLGDAPPPDRWAAWLRRRARPERAWIHPGVMMRLASDSRVHIGGAAAAAAAEVGVGGGVDAERVFYLRESDLVGVMRGYRARPDPVGELLLMVVGDDVVTDLGTGEVAPAVALVDLLGSPDARQRHLAARLLESAVQRIEVDSSRR